MIPGPREELAALARQDDARIDVARGALLIAAETCPDVDVEAQLAVLDALGRDAAAQLPESASSISRLSMLSRFLFEELHFIGNRSDYDDPRNSLLHEVLRRRTGLPITLSIVYMEVGRRAGVALAGVGFPGHFLVRSLEAPELFVDPFHARLITRGECADLLQETLGESALLRPEHLATVTPRQILTRLLGNLKRVHCERGELEQALACSERILLFAPDSPLELRDRGLIYAQLECFQPALRDLERFVELSGDPRVAAATRDTIETLRARVARIN